MSNRNNRKRIVSEDDDVMEVDPETVDSDSDLQEGDYEPERITNVKIMDGVLKFKTLWVGYPPEESTWQSVDTFAYGWDSDVIKEYMAINKREVSSLLRKLGLPTTPPRRGRIQLDSTSEERNRNCTVNRVNGDHSRNAALDQVINGPDSPDSTAVGRDEHGTNESQEINGVAEPAQNINNIIEENGGDVVGQEGSRGVQTGELNQFVAIAREAIAAGNVQKALDSLMMFVAIKEDQVHQAHSQIIQGHEDLMQNTERLIKEIASKICVDYMRNARAGSDADAALELHLAVTNNDLKTVKELVDKHGASIDARDHVGLTAVELAIIHQHPRILKFLLENGGSCHYYEADQRNNPRGEDHERIRTFITIMRTENGYKSSELMVTNVRRMINCAFNRAVYGPLDGCPMIAESVTLTFPVPHRDIQRGHTSEVVQFRVPWRNIENVERIIVAMVPMKYDKGSCDQGPKPSRMIVLSEVLTTEVIMLGETCLPMEDKRLRDATNAIKLIKGTSTHAQYNVLNLRLKFTGDEKCPFIACRVIKCTIDSD